MNDEHEDPTKGIDELKEFVNELALPNSIKSQLAELICRELNTALNLGRMKGFQDAMELGRTEFQDALEDAAKTLHKIVRDEFDGLTRPSAN